MKTKRIENAIVKKARGLLAEYGSKFPLTLAEENLIRFAARLTAEYLRKAT